MLPYMIYSQANPNRCLSWIGIKFYSLGHQLCFILFAAYTSVQNLLKTTTDLFTLETALKECRKMFIHLKLLVSINLFYM